MNNNRIFSDELERMLRERQNTKVRFDERIKNSEAGNNKLREEVFNLKIQLKTFEMSTPTQIFNNTENLDAMDSIVALHISKMEIGDNERNVPNDDNGLAVVISDPIPKHLIERLMYLIAPRPK